LFTPGKKRCSNWFASILLMQHETSFLHLTTWNFSEFHDWCCFITLQACRLQMICIHIIAYRHNGINTIQKLCFCFILVSFIFWRGGCSECIFTDTTWWLSIGLFIGTFVSDMHITILGVFRALHSRNKDGNFYMFYM